MQNLVRNIRKQVATASSFCRGFLIGKTKSPRHKNRAVATTSRAGRFFARHGGLRMTGRARQGKIADQGWPQKTVTSGSSTRSGR